MPDGLDDLSLILFVLLRKLQCSGDGNIPCDQFLPRLSRHPENGLVVLSMLIGVLDGDLGLANTTQSADGLWLGKGSRLPSLEGLGQSCQDLLASSKDEIVRVRNSPDGCNRSRERRAHEVRNEVVEELIVGQVGINCPELDIADSRSGNHKEI